LRSNDDREEISDLESLARQSFTDLTVAEIELVRAASKGCLAVCGVSDDASDSTNDPSKADEWGPERRLRPDLIVWLCLDHRASSLVHPKGVQVLGAKVPEALDLSFVTIGFPLVLARCRLLKELVLQGTHTRTISLQGSRVHSIIADGVVVDGAIFLRNDFQSEGEVRLTGARVEGPLDCSGGIFGSFDSAPALIADAIGVTGPVFLRAGFCANGEVRFHYARIGADLDCTQGTFNGTAQRAGSQFSPALVAEGVVVGGSIFLRNGFRAQGLVLLHGAQVQFNLDCFGGQFENPVRQGVLGTGTALNFDASVVRGSVSLSHSFQAHGVVSLVSAQIDGDLRCTDSEIGSDLIAERATVKGTLFWRNIRNATMVSLNLINTTVDSLSDDPVSWPPRGNLQLHGFVYARFSAFSTSDPKERLAWLARLKSFTPLPYRQLAKVLKDEGDDVGAKQVLYKMASLRDRKVPGKLARGWNLILKCTVGYGYYPVRALACLMVLAAFGYLLFWGGYYAGNIVPMDKDAYVSFRKNGRLPDYYGRFHASVYSFENSFPLVRLGQADRWQPDPSPDNSALFARNYTGLLAHSIVSATALQAFRWLQIVLGWVFATMGIASVTGLVRRD
jgi:hypothetical protein